MAGKRKAGGCPNKAKVKETIKSGGKAVAVSTHASELPDHVLHQILILLPTKLAVRASLVSKQWARVSYLLSVLDFDEDETTPYDPAKRKRFINFLYKCLNHYERGEQEMDKFRLHMRYEKGTEIIDKWLSLAVQRNVKELDIIFNCAIKWFYERYNFPSTVFNAKSLTTLRLKNAIAFEENVTVSLPSLKTMSLEDMDLDNLGFVQLISGCPCIEYLSLTSCKLSTAQVEALNLQSLRFCENRYVDPYTYKSFMINFSCPALRNLEIVNTCFDKRWLEEGLSSRFPLLESLVLRNYRTVIEVEPHTMNVDTQNLKRFVFSGGHVCTKLNINTPNLVSFTFSSTYYLSLLSAFSMNAPNLSEATINVNYNFADLPLLLNFLREFGCSRKLNLSVIGAKVLIIPEQMRKIYSAPLPSLKHLKVVINGPPAAAVRTSDRLLLDSLKWLAPNLDSLYINDAEIFTDC